MKQLRFLVFLLAVLLSLSTLIVIGAAASGSEYGKGTVTITFYDSGTTDPGTTNPGGGGGGGGSTGGGGGSGGRITGGGIRPNFNRGSGDDTVTILDPDVPLGDLGTLPKTGGFLLIPLIFVTMGMWLVYITLKMEPREKSQLLFCA